MSDNTEVEYGSSLTPDQVAEALRQGLTDLGLLKQEVAQADAATEAVKVDGARDVEEVKARVSADVTEASDAADVVRTRYNELAASLVNQGLASYGLLETMGHAVRRPMRRNKK